MKYESELIKEIVDSRGHEKSSTHYQSECVETWIDETKGAYPKLCDYQPEWLNYIVENPLGEFPYETVTDVTDATINNVVPYAYKSAILKGQTLVNLFQDMDYVWNNLMLQSNYSYTDGEIIIPNNGKVDARSWTNVPQITNVSANTEYTLIFTKGSSPYVEFGTVDESGTSIVLTKVRNAQKAKVTTPTNGDLRIKIVVENPKSTGSSINLGKVMFIEGDYTNVDIPYFEGMKSVQMPVLTTQGKNLWDNKVFEECPIATINNDGTITLNGTLQGNWLFNYTIDKGTYCASAIGNDNTYVHLFWKGFDTAFQQNYSFAISEKVTRQGYISKGTYDNVNIKLQLELGTQVTSYEPHKSNILSCLEPVELGSVGEVKDELNLLTQQLTQRTETRPYQEGDELSSEFVTDMTNTRYKLAQEVVKTVDLTVIDQDGNTLSITKPFEGTMHIHSDGTPLKPSITMEIPVEATTQNLASFIKEE